MTNSYTKRFKSEFIESTVRKTFTKKFTFARNENWMLPKAENLFSGKEWVIEELQELKFELNEIKSQLSDFNIGEWHKHTSKRSRGKDIQWHIKRKYSPELLTQAWCKFHEIISSYPLIPVENIQNENNEFYSLHLCEAPGAFVTCLNHWLKTNCPNVNWDWVAMTLNPYYEGNCSKKMISDDRFIAHTLDHWFFGVENTGDLMSIKNFLSLCDRISGMSKKLYLITADGSVNCVNNPAEQEDIVSGLHFCEIVAALNLLAENGNFLLKIFTTFEYKSICLVYFLCCVFKTIHFYKPVTSKEGNSEVYVICLGFRGKNYISNHIPVLIKHYELYPITPMIDKQDLPNDFLEQLISCGKIFKEYQCETIKNNILAYNFNDQKNCMSYEEKIIMKQVLCKFLHDFQLEELNPSLQIIGNETINGTKNIHCWDQSESYNEKQKELHLKPLMRLLKSAEKLLHFKELVSIPDEVVLEPPNVCPNLQIMFGKPYHNIQSSKFCTKRISEIYCLFFEVANAQKWSFPDKTDLSQILENYSDTFKMIHLNYTDIYYNDTTLKLVQEVVRQINYGENLILFGYHLISQFNVGLLLLLSYSFKSIKFITHGSCGCIITLINYEKPSVVPDILRNIVKPSNDSMILTLVPILTLYESKLFDIVEQIVPWILKFCINYINQKNP